VSSSLGIFRTGTLPPHAASAALRTSGKFSVPASNTSSGLFQSRPTLRDRSQPATDRGLIAPVRISSRTTARRSSREVGRSASPSFLQRAKVARLTPARFASSTSRIPTSLVSARSCSERGLLSSSFSKTSTVASSREACAKGCSEDCCPLSIAICCPAIIAHLLPARLDAPARAQFCILIRQKQDITSADYMG
jgi:hypothetical protein